MGMDVHGRAPTGEAGRYFGRNIGGWHPLANLVTALCPDEAAPCQDWHCNDGDGLDAAGAKALAAKLQALRDDGTVGTYLFERDAYLASMPRVACWRCGGTGAHRDTPARDPDFGAAIMDQLLNNAEFVRDFGGELQPIPEGVCRTCHGAGEIDNPGRGDTVDVSDVDDFIAFLNASGGFSIW